MEEEFRVRAINDYYASVTDELDLKEDAEYTILQTSPSGWWYAVNDDGEDGWVPSNYLVRIDDEDEAGYEEEAYDEEDGKEEAPTDLEEPAAAAETTSVATVPTTASKAAKKKETTTIEVPYDPVEDSGKPVVEWNVDETLAYLKKTAGEKKRNDFKLTQACRYLTQLCTKGNADLGIPNASEEILSKGGLDIIFEVMAAAAADPAIQMSCCAAVVVMCTHPAAKVHHASINGCIYLEAGLKSQVKLRPYVILALNAICNFCHNNPTHRGMALETGIVGEVIAAMDHHRGQTEGFRVHSSGCLALRNIAADPRGQGAVGPEGVEAIVKGMEEYRGMVEVVEGSMGVLCNLCALAANGEAFVMNGGLALLDNLYSDPESSDNIRLAAASVLHNLAANQDTAMLLSSEQGIDLLIKILKKNEVDSTLFLNTLRVLAALLFKLPDDDLVGGQSKKKVMRVLFERGLIASLNEAVQYDIKPLQEICATMYVVIAQTDPKLAQALADAEAPEHLIPVCMHEPTQQTLHCSVAVWFHVSDSFDNQTALAEGGIFRFLTSDWYKEETAKEDTVRIACGVFVKFFSNVRNAQLAADYDDAIQEFIRYNTEARPGLAPLCSAMASALKQLDPSTMSGGTLHVEEKYTKASDTSAAAEAEAEAKKKKEEEAARKRAEEEERKRAEVGDSTKKASAAASSAVPVGSTMGSTAPSSAPDLGKTMTLDEIKKAKGIRQDQKEAYLSDADFEALFGMPKADFYKLKPWKQKMEKKKHGLW